MWVNYCLTKSIQLEPFWLYKRLHHEKLTNSVWLLLLWCHSEKSFYSESFRSKLKFTKHDNHWDILKCLKLKYWHSFINSYLPGTYYYLCLWWHCYLSEYIYWAYRIIQKWFLLNWIINNYSFVCLLKVPDHTMKKH